MVCFLGSRCYYSIQRTLLAFHYILSVANSQDDKLPIDLIAQVIGGRRVAFLSDIVVAVVDGGWCFFLG